MRDEHVVGGEALGTLKGRDFDRRPPDARFSEALACDLQYITKGLRRLAVRIDPKTFEDFRQLVAIHILSVPYSPQSRQHPTYLFLQVILDALNHLGAISLGVRLPKQSLEVSLGHESLGDDAPAQIAVLIEK